jgi:site-specific recombinase XerD
MQTFEKYLIDTGKSKNTIKSYKRAVVNFTAWWEQLTANNFDKLLVTASELQEWKKFLIHDAKTKQNNRYEATTINSYLTGIMAYFNYYHAEGILKQNPARYLKLVRIQGGRPDIKYLNKSEKNRFARYIYDQNLLEKNPWKHLRNRAISLAMLLAGLRVSDVSKLYREDIDYKNMIIKVRDGKGNLSRRVPMNKELVVAFKEYEIEAGERIEDHFFTSQKNSYFSVDGIEHLFRKMSEETGIEHLTPHTLRHTFAKEINEDIHVIAELLGHQNINTTRIYKSATDSTKRKAVDSLSALE